MYFLSLFWVLFTHPLLDSSGKMQSNEGGKHFTGRIKESQSFTHNTVKTYNKVTIQFLLFLCFYIYIDYFSMSVLICLTFFFFFVLLKFPKSWEIRLYEKCCLSACLLQWSSLLQSWCSLMCLCPPHPHMLWISLLSLSSVLHFHRSVPFPCLSVTPSPHSSFSYHMSKSVTYHVAKFVFHPLPKHFWHSLSLYCTEAVLTQQFYMQQINATPRPSTPSSGCLPQFPFKEDVTASFIHVFFSHSDLKQSACHWGNNAIVQIIIFQ